MACAWRDEQSDLMTIAPPQAPRLREAPCSQRRAQRREPFSGIHRLTLKISRHAKLDADNTLLAPTERNDLVDRCVLLAAGILSLATIRQKSRIRVKEDQIAGLRQDAAVLEPTASYLAPNSPFEC